MRLPTTLEALILVALSHGEAGASTIHQWLKKNAHAGIQLGSVYKSLGHLDEAGLVKIRLVWRDVERLLDKKRSYAITKKGRKELKKLVRLLRRKK